MKDSPPHNSKILFGPMQTRTGAGRYSGHCAWRSRGASARLTPSPFPSCSAKKKPSAALPKRSKNYKIKRMHRSLPFVIALSLVLAVPVLADEATSTPPDPNTERHAHLDATNAQIQKLKDEIAALQKDLNSTT